MATILQFVSAKHSVGRNQEIWAQIGPAFIHVGNGTFSSLSTFEIACSGSAKIGDDTYEGSLRVRLTDGNASASSGPCRVDATGFLSSGAGTYRVDGDKLLLSLDSGDTAVIKPVEWGKETAIEVAGSPAIHIKPM